MTGKFGHDAVAAVVYSDDQVLLLFGQSDECLAPAREAAERAGCRIADEVSIADGPDRLDRQVAADAALVVADRQSAELDLLLTRLEGEARAGRIRTVVWGAAELIDPVEAIAPHGWVQHLVERVPEQLVLALAMACARPAPALHDVAKRDGTAVLQQLSEDAARIANILASLSSGEADAGDKMDAGGEESDEGAVDAAFVRSIIRARRMRDQFLRGGLFGDPAWDMLLDLMAARLEGNRVAVSSLCIAAAVPATTALRWIKSMTEHGLFVRSADPQDGRRVYIELSDATARAMNNYLAAVQRSGQAAI